MGAPQAGLLCAILQFLKEGQTMRTKSTPGFYYGWTIDYVPNNPVTGKFVAQRFGVEMCAHDAATICRMIDQRHADEKARLEALRD